uniref:Uncharacterized protein n=1 Tax=Mus musculus TaxID=10090 RepID=Q3UVZ7_MOUSE|nr:unnamed protein product [Mus musculus]
MFFVILYTVLTKLYFMFVLSVHKFLSGKHSVNS